MNGKQKFLKIARFELSGAIFLPSCWNWFWERTIERWKKEGLPGDVHIEEYFGLDRMEYLPVRLNRKDVIIPPFERVLLSEDQTHQVIIDFDGAKKKIFKENRQESMDQWLEYPVKDRKTWNEYKKRLDPSSPLRFPCWWEQEKERFKNATYPVGVSAGSFFGWIRTWIGIENMSYLIVDDPGLIEDMEEHLEYLFLSVLERVLKDVKVDFAHFWEDMAYKTGPLVSPSFVKKFMVPHYKKITEFLRSKGVDIITLDSDGNIWELIPIWLECGINGVLPNEVAAGMDVVEMRKKFGKNLIICGGIDKRVLLKSKKDIEEEVKRKVGTLLEDGGYFPVIDHAVPPDVPFKNFMYYLEILKKSAT
ncbi:MAG TPA: uroporphyrinogen decarboxylase family protein [bacterium]|nr:uroporphyrinogen decarboxylase family protein [bacterium]